MNVAGMQAARMDFQIALGDLAYDANQELWWCKQWSDANISNLFIVSGNHDANESCCGNLTLYLETCPRSLPVNGTYGLRYFFDYPTVNPLARLIFITPGVVGLYASWNTYALGGEGYLWVQSALDDARANNITWIVVVMHKNYISVLQKSNELGTDLMPLLFSRNVDLVLQGHEHGYERTKQLKCAVVNSFEPSCVGDASNNLTQGNGTVIVVLGTGGAALRTYNAADPELGYFASADITAYGFGHFFVTQNRLEYSFVGTSGGTFNDSFVILRSLPQPPSTSPPTPTTSVSNSSVIVVVIALFLAVMVAVAVAAVCKMNRSGSSHLAPIAFEDVPSE